MQAILDVEPYQGLDIGKVVHRFGKMELDRTMGPVRHPGLVRHLGFITDQCLWPMGDGGERAGQGGSLSTRNKPGPVQRIAEVAQPPDLFPAAQTGYFFQQTRLDGAEFYYSRQESWAGLAIDRPPQPIGYPFYSMDPK